ncbi:hypothetical protein HY389_01530 [Candidatus Daviesbacteria bacterium]|nr:hypothetical protein [Candidatus Daviesbacteria bacterium]
MTERSEVSIGGKVLSLLDGNSGFGPNPRESNNDERHEIADAEYYQAQIPQGSPEWNAKRDQRIEEEVSREAMKMRIIAGAMMGGGTLVGVIGYILSH